MVVPARRLPWGEILVVGRDVSQLTEMRAIVLQALARPKKRRPTRPTRGSKEARLSEKRHRAATKRIRRRPAED